MILREIIIHSYGQREYPFSVPALADLTKLSFDTPITIFVGENGSGKSTLLEGIAKSCRAINIGLLDSMEQDDTLVDCYPMKPVFHPVRRKQTCFLRSEDFINFIHRMHQLKKEMRTSLDDVDRKHARPGSYSHLLERSVYQNSLQALEQRYAHDLTKRSHGEGYLDFFKARLQNNSLYFLDEPETPLSMQNLLTLATMIQEGVANESQFIICTHSPILMAMPHATIYEFSDRVASIAFEEVESVQMLKQFMQYPEAFMRHLAYPPK